MLFYDLYRDDKYEDAEYADGTDWESIICPRYDGHQRAGNRIGQLKIELQSKQSEDFLWTFLSECLITDRVATIFKENSITGYELKKVEVVNSSSAQQIWEFIVTGQGGDAHKDSGIYLKKQCKYCSYKRYSAFENGIIIDEKNWDGSDVFTVNGYGNHVIVTEKVKQLIERSNFSGVNIMPSNELKWPDGVIKP